MALEPVMKSFPLIFFWIKIIHSAENTTCDTTTSRWTAAAAGENEHYCSATSG